MAPHIDGLWKATVKFVKHHLVWAIGDQILTFVEPSTLLARTEAILKSRPLGALRDDINDLEILTPADFIISLSYFLVPEPDYTEENIPLGKRYQLQTQMEQHFWKRWVREYVTALQQRNKWQLPQKSQGVGNFSFLTL